MHQKRAIAIAGKNEIAVHGLLFASEHFTDFEIIVLTNRNDEGFDTWQPSLKKKANELGVPIVTLEQCYNREKLIFVSLEFDQIIDPKKFLTDKLYNIHFSKLPAYKGMYTSALPLLHGEKESGVTLHKIDRGIDTGAIIDQRVFDLSDISTAACLYKRYSNEAKHLLTERFSDLISGKYSCQAQAPEGSSYYSSRSIDYGQIKLNLTATAEQIKNQIRAFTFPAYQVPQFRQYSFCGATITTNPSKCRPGKILQVTPTDVTLSTIDYDIVLSRHKFQELMEACQRDDTQIVESTPNLPSIVNDRNGKGWTPLIAAAFNGSLNVMSSLIRNGANVNRPSFKGTTPVMYAMSHYEETGDRRPFDMLVQSKANLELKDIHGKTLFDYGRERNVTKLFS